MIFLHHIQLFGCKSRVPGQFKCVGGLQGENEGARGETGMGKKIIIHVTRMDLKLAKEDKRA